MFKILKKIGKSKNILCTIATGKHYKLFTKYSYKSWRLYAKNNDLGIIVISDEIDKSDTAKKANWQKYIIGEYLYKNVSKDIKNIAFLDSDIIINPESPNIFKYHNESKISVVSVHHNLPFSLNDILKTVSFYRNKYYSKKYPLNSSIFFTPQEKYKFHKYKVFKDYYCAGMFVFNCRKFKNFFKKFYSKYTANDFSLTGGDQSAFNYEINKLGKIKILDYKFQAIWLYEMAWKYPFLYKPSKNKDIIKECINASVRDNYFLHFAGAWHESEMIKVGTFPYDNKNYQEFKKLFKYKKSNIKSRSYGPIKPKK
jgi:hypothetical protein